MICRTCANELTTDAKEGDMKFRIAISVFLGDESRITYDFEKSFDHARAYYKIVKGDVAWH